MKLLSNWYEIGRDFTGGTLGLAWVASPSGASGGICERYKTYTENMAGYPRTTKRSLNTGIITFVNYNSRVPPKVSQLTLAHEIGHNFGSPHDYPSHCRPGGTDGEFLFFFFFFLENNFSDFSDFFHFFFSLSLSFFFILVNLSELNSIIFLFISVVIEHLLLTFAFVFLTFDWIQYVDE